MHINLTLKGIYTNLSDFLPVRKANGPNLRKITQAKRFAKVHWRYWHEVVARPRDFDSFPRRSQQLPTEHKVYGWNFNQAARVSGHQIKSCRRYNICWSVYKTNRYTPVSPTHKVPPETLLQKWSDSDTFESRARDCWPPLQTGLSETGNFTCHWESTATKERRPTFF